MSVTTSCPFTALIADFDIYSSSESGADFYRRLFARFPEIHFAYFREREPEDLLRPSNVSTIATGATFRPNHQKTPENELWFKPFATATPLAAAIGSRDFDLVEIPLYNAQLVMLPQALRKQGMRVTTSLLGRRSQRLLTGWDQTKQTLHRAELYATWEKWLVQTADRRYGLSRDQVEYWEQQSGLAVEYVSPFSLLDAVAIKGRYASALPEPSTAPPNLVFLGQTERINGPDLYLELLWRLPRTTYGKAMIVGKPTSTDRWMSSTEWLKLMARHRDLDVEIVESLPQEQLTRLLAGRTILVLPSRYDAMNLTAIAAMLASCPTVFGAGSSLCRTLSEECPDMPVARFDLKDMDANAEQVSYLLDNFDIARATLNDAIRQYAPPMDSEYFTVVSAKPAVSDAATRTMLTERYIEQRTQHERARTGLIEAAKRRLRARFTPARIADWLRRQGQTWFVAAYHWSRASQAYQLFETTPDDIRKKILAFEELVHGERFGRAWVWSELSRLEALAGRELVSAAYALRVMRLAGRDRLGELPRVLQILRNHRFLADAEAVELLYGSNSPEQRHHRLLQWLDDRRERFLINPTTEFEKVDDRRTGADTKVAVIVSLYNAAPKIKKFLDSLAQQTLMKQGLIEVVLVDSGSPIDEYSPIVKHAVFTTKPAIYLRTPIRETIQQAWNRGLSVARSPYVTMLGCDETVLPECLERLSRELDRRPELDWIQSNSLMVETDAAGNYERDAGCYDRTGYQQELHRLECCYLSFVGALSRRSLHERFGYYDPSFRGAGDTEFKNRILPEIHTAAYPRTLGLFWNYPEIRTTQNPLGEIEDYRAWHVHRSAAGVEYAHRKTDPQAIVAAAGQALRYRVSHQPEGDTTDLEYACELLSYARHRDPNCLPEDLLRDMCRLLEDFRSLDWAGWQGLGRTVVAVRPMIARMERLNQRLKEFFANQPKLTYFNDERCVHINWCWSYLK